MGDGISCVHTDLMTLYAPYGIALESSLVSARWRGECFSVCTQMDVYIVALPMFARTTCFISLAGLLDATNGQDLSTQWLRLWISKKGGVVNEAVPEWSVRITQALPMSSEVSSQPHSVWIKCTIRWIRFRGMFKNKHCGTVAEEQNKRKLHVKAEMCLWGLQLQLNKQFSSIIERNSATKLLTFSVFMPNAYLTRWLLLSCLCVHCWTKLTT